MRNHESVVLRQTLAMSPRSNSWTGAPGRVLWVGPYRVPPWNEIVAAIERAGLAVEFDEAASDLCAMLKRSPRSPIVLCKTEANPRFEAALSALAAAARSNPVLVLAERSEFGDYYDLMHRGATYYYEAGEEPSRIALALRRAADALREESSYGAAE